MLRLCLYQQGLTGALQLMRRCPHGHYPSAINACQKKLSAVACFPSPAAAIRRLFGVAFETLCATMKQHQVVVEAFLQPGLLTCCSILELCISPLKWSTGAVQYESTPALSSLVQVGSAAHAASCLVCLGPKVISCTWCK